MQNSLPNNYKLNARYTILHQIGQGGFGITYKARDTLFDRVVCIKELFLSGNSRREESWSVSTQTYANKEFTYFKAKFLEEAKKLANFNHPNIVRVLEYFEANNTAYMVMEFVEGKNLKSFVEEQIQLNEEQAIDIFCQLLETTRSIHEKSYLHRDITPNNVLITSDKRVVLIDFGTAKFQDNQGDNENTSTLVMVSHGYAPPEQYSAEGKKGEYTDIYALGATLYFMLTGQKPLQATERTINELKAVTVINPNVSEGIEKVVSKAMELKPSNRYQKISEIINDLNNESYNENEANIICATIPHKNPYKNGISQIELEKLKNILVDILYDFDVEVIKIKANIKTETTDFQIYINNSDVLADISEIEYELVKYIPEIKISLNNALKVNKFENKDSHLQTYTDDTTHSNVPKKDVAIPKRTSRKNKNPLRKSEERFKNLEEVEVWLEYNRMGQLSKTFRKRTEKTEVNTNNKLLSKPVKFFIYIVLFIALLYTCESLKI